MMLTRSSVPPRALLDRKRIENTDPREPFPWFTDFCGIEMGHNFYVYHILSSNLAKHPDIRAIIEFGTGLGALAVYCGLLGFQRQIPVHTFDVRRYFLPTTDALFRLLGVRFHEIDIFSDVARAQVSQIVGSKPTYLICDNGNKQLEFESYAPILPRGSLISVHDLGIEFNPEGVRAADLEPVDPAEWFKFNCQFGTWKKR